MIFLTCVDGVAGKADVEVGVVVFVAVVVVVVVVTVSWRAICGMEQKALVDGCCWRRGTGKLERARRRKARCKPSYLEHGRERGCERGSGCERGA